MTAKEIFNEVWIEHFGHTKETDEQLEIVQDHDYIFEAMERYKQVSVEPVVMQKIADTVKDIMQEGFEIAMGGNIDLSEEANRREQTARYDRAVKNYTEIIARNFSA